MFSRQHALWTTMNASLLACMLMLAGCLQPIDEQHGPDNGDEPSKPPQKPISSLVSPAKEVATALRQSRLARSELALSMVDAIREGKSQEELKQLWNVGDAAISKDANAVITAAIKKALATEDADAAEAAWKAVAAGYAY